MRSCVKWLSTLYIYQVTFIEEEPGELYVSGQKIKNGLKKIFISFRLFFCFSFILKFFELCGSHVCTLYYLCLVALSLNSCATVIHKKIFYS